MPPKFQRKGREERREALVAATLQCLKLHGHEGASVRRISAEAGVSMGLINHHFGGSAALVAAAYEALSNRFLDAAEQAAGAARGLAPAQRLRAWFESYYAPEVLDPGVFRVWLVFWSLMAHSPEIRAAHAVTARRNRALLERMLRALRGEPGVAPFRPAPAATALAALMDGLWVTISLNPSALRARDAVRLCEDWVAGLAAGNFQSLKAPAPV